MIRKFVSHMCAGMTLLVSVACAVEPDHPAVITNATSAARAELQQTVGKALGDPGITLADDALVSSNTLIVERARRLDPNGLLANGRETKPPEHFELMRSGSRCVLVRTSTRESWTLQHVTCRAQPAQ
ncbi:MAG: hypothetical protein ABI616_15215 [Pseudomonadota bacterium]